MKKIKCILLVIALILIMVSGCSINPRSISDSAIPFYEEAITENEANTNKEVKVQKDEASEPPIISISDEKDRSLHNGELYAKNGNILIYAGDFNNIYMVNTQTKENGLLVIRIGGGD